MTPLEQVRAALEQAGSRTRSPGAWTCPAHDDQHASLSVEEGRDGRVLLNCHANAGCEIEGIVAALGLTMADLFPPKPDQGGAGDDWTPAGPAIATYLYVDEHGKTLFGVCRTADKQFRQWRPDPSKKHGKAWSLKGITLVLYRLPRVLEAVDAGQPIYVAEGEKDVHALERAGVVATCNPMGAGKWRATYSKTLAGATVVIVADNDEPGHRHARDVAAKLGEAGCMVRLVKAAEGKDAADHLAAGHGLDELVELEPKPAGEPASAEPEQLPDFAREDGALILDSIEDAYKRYVHFQSDHQAVAATLWTAHTHAVDQAATTPYLDINSAEPESGKSRVLEVAEHLVLRPWMLIEPSEAVVYRTIEQDHPTLLLDEADTIWNGKNDGREGLRAIFNAGYRKGATVPRCVGEGAKMVKQDFPVFGAKAIAGIGRRPRTIASRSIPIRLRRRTKAEPVERFRQTRAAGDLKPLRLCLAAWVELVKADLEAADPSIPEQLSDRQADCWEPLLAIADAAGGDWPKRARAAAAELHGHDPAADPSIGVLLLAHIREAFIAGTDDKGDVVKWHERLTTEALLRALCDRDDGPWAGWWAATLAKEETKGPASKLSHLLKPYEITPTQYKAQDEAAPSGQRKVRGYLRSAFSDAFGRYLGTSQVTGRNGTVPPDPSVPSPQAVDQQGTEVPSPDTEPRAPAGSMWERNARAERAADRFAAAEGDARLPKWACDTCGHRTAALNNMTGLPHAKCGGRFQPAEATR